MTDSSSQADDNAPSPTANESDVLAKMVASALHNLKPPSADLLVKAAKEGTLGQKLKKSEMDTLAEQLIQAELSIGRED